MKEGCSSLLALVVLKLSEKLSLTSGQVAVAAELLAREKFQGKKSASVTESINAVLASIGLQGEVEVRDEVYAVKVLGEKSCPLKKLCPLPFYVASGTRILSGAKVYPVWEEGQVVHEENNLCVFRLKPVKA